MNVLALRGLKVAAVLSGAAALIAETLWVRSFASMVGATVEAAAATFAAFLVGLALGAYLAGRRTDALRAPLRAYAAVEGAIALAVAATGLGLFHFRDQLIIGGSSGGLGRAALVFAVVLVLIVVPTTLMGATFPVMVSSARRCGAPVAVIGRLYTLNTFGAAVGTVACGFVFIPTLGVRASVLVGASLNAAAAAISLAAGRNLQATPSSTAPSGTAVPPPPGDGTPQWALLLVAFASGAITLGVEVVWTRLASYFLGNRIYAFSTLVACVLVLLSAGSWVSEHLLAKARRRLLEALGAILLVGALGTLGSGWLTDWYIHHQPWIDGKIPSGPVVIAWQLLKTLLLLAPMIIPLGCLFPLSLTAARLSEEKSGLAAGVFYLVNTVGSVLGSLGVGFWAISAAGALGSVGYLVAAGTAVAAAIFLTTVHSAPFKLGGLAAATAALSLVPALLPPQLSVVGPKEELVVRKEDAYGIFQVVRLPDDTLRVTENKTALVYYLGAYATSYVQQMQGHLGVFFNPRARNALVLGSGYGITAGALGLYSQLERIDAVEIIPAMVESADLFMPFNLGYHRNPRVRIAVDDGRHFLARSPNRYDIISINVSDPRLPGSANFFHADFYQVVKKHLNPNGVVLQHAFGTELRVVLTTLSRSFRHVLLFPAYSNGFNVVAADQPLKAAVGEIERLTSPAPVRRALEALGLLSPLVAAQVYSTGLAPEDFPSLFSETRIASDDQPFLEFSGRGGFRDLFASNE